MMGDVQYTNKQMLVMGPDRWPDEDQPRAFFTVTTPEHKNLVRFWPWDGVRDHLSIGPDWEWSRHYPLNRK